MTFPGDAALDHLAKVAFDYSTAKLTHSPSAHTVLFGRKFMEEIATHLGFIGWGLAN